MQRYLLGKIYLSSLLSLLLILILGLVKNILVGGSKLARRYSTASKIMGHRVELEVKTETIQL